MILPRRPSGTSARQCKLYLICEVDVYPFGDEPALLLPTATGERQVADLAVELSAKIGDSTVRLWCIGTSYQHVTGTRLASRLGTEIAHKEDWHDGQNSLTWMERTRPRGRPRFPGLGQLAQNGGMPGHVVLIGPSSSITYIRQLAGIHMAADRFSTSSAQGQVYSLTLDATGRIGTPE